MHRQPTKTNPLKLHDNKIVRLTEFFEGLIGKQQFDKNSVQQCRKYDRITLSAYRLENLFAYPTNFIASIEKKLHRLFGVTT